MRRRVLLTAGAALIAAACADSSAPTHIVPLDVPAALNNGGGVRIRFDQQVVPSFRIGMTFQFSVTITGPSDQTLPNRRVTWSTSDPTIGTVSASGLVTAVGVGRFIITASSGNASVGVSLDVYSSDSDGDGVPDEQDSCPFDPNCQ